MSADSLVWFITGTSAGFGSQLVKQVLARGDRVIATGRTLEKIKHYESPSCRVLQLDVTDTPEKIQGVAKEAASIWGRVDVVVNNAGFGAPGVAEEMGLKGYMHQFNANFFGVVNINNAFLPYLRQQKSGTIVVIGSRHAWKSLHPLTGAYAASKAAVHAYAEALSTEVAQFGIRTLIVQPGAHRTDVITSARSNIVVESLIDDYQKLREAGASRYANQNGKQPGDPVKAMKALIDVVRGEGLAAGKPWPLWLVLGRDAEEDLRNNCVQRLQILDEWAEVTRSTTVDDENIVLI